jgi:PAS domain S-box-containing protein
VAIFASILLPDLSLTPLAPYVLAVAVVAAYWGTGPALEATALAVAVVCGWQTPSLLTPTGVLWVLSSLLITGLAVGTLSALRGKAEAGKRTAEETLQHWKSLAEASGDAVLSQSLDGTVTGWNRAAAKLFGYAESEILGTSISRLVPEERRDEHKELVARLQRGEYVVSVETERLTRDGRRIWVAVTSLPILGPAGAPMGATVVYHDIDARRRAEEALAESEERLRAIVTEAPIPIMVHTVEGKALAMSRAFTRITGYTPEDIPDADAWLQKIYGVPGEQLDEARRLFCAKCETVACHAKEERVIETKTGENRTWIIHASHPQSLSNGSRVMASMAVDVTEWKQAEENLRRYELLAEHSRDVVMFINQDDGRLLEANAAAVHAYGYARDEFLQLTIHDLRAEALKDIVTEQMIVAGAKGILFETVHRRKDGSTFPVEVSAQGASLGGVRTLISVVRDITERKQAEESLHLSQEMFATAFASNPAAIAVTRFEDGLLLEVNDTWVHLLGYTREEVTGRSARELSVWPNTRALERFIEELRDKGSLRGWEQEFVKKSGEIIVVQYSAQLLTMRGEKVILSTLVDVTDRKRAEEALRASEKGFRVIFDNAGVGIVEVTGNDRFVAANDRACEIMGRLREELLAMNVHEATWPDDRELSDRLNASLHEGKSDRVEYEKRYARPDGSYVWTHVTVSAVRDESGNWVRSITTIQDITQRKHAQQALQESEARLRAFQETSLDGFIVFRAVRENGRIVDLEFTYANPAAERVTGHGRLVGKRLLEVLPGHGGPGGMFEHYLRVIETGEPHDMEFYYEGEGIRGWFRNMSVKLGDGVAMAFSDITSRKLAEEALQESEARHRTIVENLTEGLVASDLDGHLFHWNRAALELHGFKTLEECRKKLREFSDIFEISELDGTPVDFENWPMARLLRGERLQEWELQVRRLDRDWERVYSYGGTLVYDGNNKPIMAILTITDVTERNRAEQALRHFTEKLEAMVQERTLDLARSHEALRQSERLATLGQAMAVLSHENRNALQNCLAALQMLRRIVDKEGRHVKYVEAAIKALDGLRHTYEDIRQYAAEMKLEKEPASLTELWRETWTDLTARLIERDVHLVEAWDAGNCFCEMDRARIKQVFRNIIENSLDACPDPVEITVSCERAALDSQSALRITVLDNGPNAQEIDTGRIMEAFYTTKAKGTGLGLAVVQRVVEAHGGRVHAGPAPDRGFQVVVHLPCSAQ